MARLDQRQEGKKLIEVARYLFHGEPDDLNEQSEALGIVLPPEKQQSPDVEVEPECAAVVRMFQRVSSQWRMGRHGPVGLDLNVVLSIASLQSMEPDAQLEMIDDLTIMERTWLEEWRKGGS